MSTRPRIRLGLERLEDRVLPSAAPNLQMTFATTTDSRTVSVNYTINGGDFTGQAVSFNIYRSSGYNSLSGAQLIGTASLPASDSADLSQGTHQGVKLSLTASNGQPLTALTPNPSQPFLVVVANPGGSSASFETHVLGVVSHGLELDPFLWFFNLPPTWETQLAAALQQQDGYEAALAFDWGRLSILPFPWAIQLAGAQLAQQVQTEADQLASQHPGDVVDINYIGHSRGTVVVSEAANALSGSSDPALKGGYVQMTLLDPHPANNLYSVVSFVRSIPAVDAFATVVVLFHTLAQDSQVVVPSNVQQVQEYDEQSPAGQIFPEFTEDFLNFWGELPSSIPDHSAAPIRSVNLTNLVAPGIGLIGHVEVHDWYMANVVDTDKTFTYFG